MQEPSSRRDFFQSLLGSAFAATLAEQVLAQTESSPNGIPTRPLGRTKQRVSIIGVGGAHMARTKDRAESLRIIHAAIDEGVTFMDNAWDYSDGLCEEIMGEGLSTGGRRNKVFLMTKNCERDYAGSMKNLEDSLRRLRTDRIDLWQFHEINYDSDPDWVFEKGGMKAALEAQKAGKIRFIGFTGHKHPLIHLNMLARHPWDAVLMPINIMDATYRSFQKQVVPECLKRNIGVIGIKSLGGGYILKSGKVTPQECIRYALSLPISVQVTGITSMEILKQNVDVARGFQPMGEAEKTALLARVKDIAGDGRFELFKSSQRFDGVHHRRQHGFEVA
jgi:predicted aldo/keto reductase-like oxidoreductase